MGTCSIGDCDRPSAKRGWCTFHYQKWNRTGDPLGGRRYGPRNDPEARFWSYVEKTDGCWLWTGTRTSNGRTDHPYGLLSVGPRYVRAHRYSYELHVGPIPKGKQLDHLCRTTLCVRPDHLEPTSNRENTVRGTAAEVNRTRQLALTHCKNGHEFTPENTYQSAKQRKCRACARDRMREYNRRKREAAS